MRKFLLATLLLACFSASAQNRIWPLKGSLRVYENMRLSGLNVGEGKVLLDTTGTGWVNFWAPPDSLFSATSGDTTWVIYRPFLYGYGGSTSQDTVLVIGGGGGGTTTGAKNGLSIASDTVILGGDLTQNTTIYTRGFDLDISIDNQWTWQADSNLAGAGRGGQNLTWTDGTTSFATGASEFATGVRDLSRFIRSSDTLVTDVRQDWQYIAGFKSGRRKTSLLIDSFLTELRYSERSPNDTAVVLTIGRAPVAIDGQPNVLRSHARISAGSRTSLAESEIFVFTDSVVLVSDQGAGTSDFVAKLSSLGGFWSVSGGDLEYRQLEDSAYYLGIRDVAPDTTNWKPAVFNAATDEFVAMSSWPQFSQLSGDSFYGAQTDSTIQLILKVGASRRDTVAITTDPAYNVLSTAVDTVYGQLFAYSPVDLRAGAAVVYPPSGPLEPGDWWGVSDIYASAAANEAVVDFPSGSQKLYNVSVSDTINVNGTTRTYIFMDNTTEWVRQE